MEISKEHSDLIEKVSTHMQFHGYETLISKDDPREIIAKHNRLPTIIIAVFPKAVRFMAIYTTREQTREDRLGILEYTNALNSGSIAAQYVINKNDDLVIMLWLFAPYERIGFAEFLDVWDEDIEKVFRHKDTVKFLG